MASSSNMNDYATLIFGWNCAFEWSDRRRRHYAEVGIKNRFQE